MLLSNEYEKFNFWQMQYIELIQLPESFDSDCLIYKVIMTFQTFVIWDFQVLFFGRRHSESTSLVPCDNICVQGEKFFLLFFLNGLDEFWI